MSCMEKLPVPTNAAEKFAKDFQKLVEEEGYTPHQLFNCDETGLFWKRMPNRTYITKEEKKLPGHKPMKDRLTLLFAANASGIMKVKPLLVYHSESPRVFKKKAVVKSKLAVYWKSNRKAWVTRLIFKEWILEVFAPSVKKFLEDNDMPLKALLLMDNEPRPPEGPRGGAGGGLWLAEVVVHASEHHFNHPAHGSTSYYEL